MIKWMAVTEVMPPVFIVVCNNTRTSKILFDYIAGYENYKAGTANSKLPKESTRVYSVDDRAECLITFPRVTV